MYISIGTRNLKYTMCPKYRWARCERLLAFRPLLSAIEASGDWCEGRRRLCILTESTFQEMTNVGGILRCGSNGG
jgi:hypothetical protein